MDTAIDIEIDNGLYPRFHILEVLEVMIFLDS